MKKRIAKVVALAMGTTMTMSVPVFASSGGWDSNNIADIMQSQGFVGSAEIINKMSWVGWVVSTIISVCCLIGLAMLAIRIIVSLLYLSNKNLFDQVSAIKQSNSFGGLQKDWKSGFGLFSLTGLGNINHMGEAKVQGLDAILVYIMSLLPDVKEWSDFGSSGEFGGDGDGGMKAKHMRTSEYILKISIPAILNIFFFSIGYNGTLWRTYTTVSGYMGDVLSALVDTNLDEVLGSAVGDNFGYKFAFSAKGDAVGNLEQTAAKAAYRQAMKQINGTDKNAAVESQIGANIENIISKMNFKDGLSQIDGVSLENEATYKGIKIATTYLVPSNVYEELEGENNAWRKQNGSKALIAKIPISDIVTGVDLPATEANGGISGFLYLRATLSAEKTSVNFWTGDTTGTSTVESSENTATATYDSSKAKATLNSDGQSITVEFSGSSVPSGVKFKVDGQKLTSSGSDKTYTITGINGGTGFDVTKGSTITVISNNYAEFTITVK